MNEFEIKGDFLAIRESCIEICRTLNTYEDLFFSGNDELLMKVAGHFFNDIAHIMTRDWIIQVCKLMDPGSTFVGRGDKRIELENLTIKSLNSRLETLDLMTSEIQNVSMKILSYGELLKPARNKRLAHLDRNHYFSDIILGATSREEMLVFLNDIQTYCDLIGIAVGEGPLEFRSSNGPGDVLDLLKTLNKCLIG